MRIIHACGDVGIGADVEASTDLVTAARNALRSGRSIWCDVLVDVEPGISAAHSLASRVGGPLGDLRARFSDARTVTSVLDPGVTQRNAHVAAEHVEAAARGVGVRSVYQPIVDLHRLAVVGYEALTRFDHPDGDGPSPDVWFAAAASAGLAPALEAATLASALSRRADLPANCFLTLNVEPMSLGDPIVRRVLSSQGHLRGVIVELTEHRSWEWDDLRPSIEWLRGLGALVAVDDAGAGHSGLRQILELRPSLLKLDRAIVAGVDRDEAKAALVEMMGLFASRVDAWLLAEGIETPGEAKRLIDLGVPLAQGYLFGRPSPPWLDVDPDTVADLRRFDDERCGTLHALVEPVPAVPESATWAREWLARDEQWLAVVDERHRPVGVVDADAALVGELVMPLLANVHARPDEIAARLSTAEADPRAPVAVIDDAGRYLGLVSLRRLLAHFASSAVA